MNKKKTSILIIVIVFVSILAYAIYWDQTRCYEVQSRCNPYDLTKVTNSDDIEFFRWLNEKCMGKCWTAKLRLNVKKRLCRQKYKQYVEKTKDRRYFKVDTYNPCPELYTLPELNKWLRS